MTRWQSEWGLLSRASKRRLTHYSGGGITNVKKMRLGMYTPRLTKEKLSRANKIAEHTFKIRIRHELVKVVSCKTHPFAIMTPDRTGFVCMPSDPLKEAILSGYAGRGARKAPGHYRMATLAHEFSELYVMYNKTRRNKFGKLLRTHHNLLDGSSDHSSVHPLVAELNHAGRNPATLRAVISEWGSREAQAGVFSVMKQCGWTPTRGIAMYGRTSNSIQKRVERLFTPYFKVLIDKRIKRLARKYRGKTLDKKIGILLKEARLYAGGKEITKEYS